MAEPALSYIVTLVIAGNLSVIAALVGIVVLVPRATRRRPAHRAETAPLQIRLAHVPARPGIARRTAAPAARAA